VSQAIPAGSEKLILANGEVSHLARSYGLETFAAAVHHVQSLPYGRTTERSDYRLVLSEGRGTCSTKHALLAALARENGLAVHLILGVYEMTQANTPGVGGELSKHGLPSIPEAHCYLRVEDGVIDVTMPEGSPSGAERRFLHKETISPEDISTYKTAVHRRVLNDWLRAVGHAELGLNAAWAIREACIAALSHPGPGPQQGMQEP